MYMAHVRQVLGAEEPCSARSFPASMAAMASAQDFVSSQPWAVIASVLIVVGTAAYLQSPHYKVCFLIIVGD
jgi:hypothetical protein